MLTTKHTGQTLWLNKKETEDPWMPMIKRTAGEKLINNKLYSQLYTLHTPSISLCSSSVILFCLIPNVYPKNRDSSLS